VEAKTTTKGSEMEHINILRETLNTAWKRGFSVGWTIDDAISAALTAQDLLRANNLAEDDRATSALKLYRKVMETYQFPEGHSLKLRESMFDTLSELTQYAEQNILERDKEKGIEILLGIDEILNVACVAKKYDWDTGMNNDRLLTFLSSMAKETAWELAPHLADLSEYAENRELEYAKDFECFDAYDWWECLAALAPSRIQLAMALQS
tara:strand:+ start:1327 stop:1953 length:627 start_codon:yes stop_codon:yes gene_type:complete